MDKKTWKEFSESGLLWFVNRLLHIFGWAIVFERDTETGDVLDVYPARVLVRGFTSSDEYEGFENLTNFVAANIADIAKDFDRDDDAEKRRADFFRRSRRPRKVI